jgi:hypothetical protein
MSEDEVARWTKAAEDISTPQVLARIADHNKAVVRTVAIVGTLLAGLGGVAAAISFTWTTFYWQEIPVVPVGALTTSVLAGIAVAIALFGSRPQFALLSTDDLMDVKDWYVQEANRGKWAVRIASCFFIAAALVAATTSAVAGGLAISRAPTDPRNLAGLSATYGRNSAVEVHLSGSVDGLDQDEHLQVAVISNAPEGTVDGDLIGVEVYPDETGKATLDSVARAPVYSTQVTASIWVLGKGETVENTTQPPTSGRDFTLTATYPKVPKPEQPANSQKPAE